MLSLKPDNDTLLQAALALPYMTAYTLAPDACHAAVAGLEA